MRFVFRWKCKLQIFVHRWRNQTPELKVCNAILKIFNGNSQSKRANSLTPVNFTNVQIILNSFAFCTNVISFDNLVSEAERLRTKIANETLIGKTKLTSVERPPLTVAEVKGSACYKDLELTNDALKNKVRGHQNCIVRLHNWRVVLHQLEPVKSSKQYKNNYLSSAQASNFPELRPSFVELRRLHF